VAVFPIGRREFLAALASLGLVPSRGLGSTRYPVHLRKANPYDGVLAHVVAGTDEFPFEKEALEIEGNLSAMLRGMELPVASDFTGASVMPLRYRTIASGVSEAEFGAEGAFQDGLARWIQSLGSIRRAGFFVLPDNVVRYEIATDGAYRVGFWKQVWAGGKLRELQLRS